MVGAGAIGCLVGGRLAGVGCQVVLLGRARLVETVTNKGLSLQWPDGRQQTVYPEAIESLASLADLSSFDLVLLTVKSFDTEAAIAGLVDQLAPQARVLSLQNGVGNEEFLAARLPEQAILAGSITLPVAVPAIGKIIVTKEKGGIGLAPLSAGAAVADIADLLRQAGFVVAEYERYQSLKWSKLLLNIIGNASSAILDMPPGQSLAHSKIFDLELAALREALAVMAALKIKVVAMPDYPLPWLALALRWLPTWLLRRALRPIMVGGRGDKLPSLQLDLRQGRNQSEVQVLNGVIALQGERLGVAVPVNRTVSDILNGIVAGRIDWADYRGQPGALARKIAELLNG